MSNATTEQVLDLPQTTTQNATPPRKITYRAGVDNPAIVKIDGEDRTTFTNFESARLIRLSARSQTAGRGENVRKMVVISMGLILDGLEVSILEDEAKVPHPMLSEPRFSKFLSLPHRVNAQQWMEVSDLDHLVNLANYLQEAHNFRIQRNPALPQNSNRKTRDLFQARPAYAHNPDSPRDFGALVNSFEISVNPEYPQGFSSFYEGLTEQMDRWVKVTSEEDEDIQRQLAEELGRNMMFVGGAYFDDSRHEWWPRPVDVGVVGIGERSFPLYPVNGDSLNADDLLSDLTEDEETTTDNGGAVVDGPAADLTDETTDW